MTIQEHDRRQQLIDKVSAYLIKQIPAPQQALVTEFVQKFYGSVAYSDLRERSVMDLAGGALSQWNFIFQRAPEVSKVRIYNPNYEDNGWQSTHTIIEVSHDDMPFLVDTIRMEITRRNIGIHLVIHTGCLNVQRDEQNCITKILHWDDDCECLSEAPIHVEITRITDENVLTDLKMGIEHALQDVRDSVTDWPAMLEKVRESIADLDTHPSTLPNDEVNETKAFLTWLMADHFTFLGYREYELMGEGDKQALRIKPHTGLGVQRDTTSSKAYRALAEMPEQVQELMLSPSILIIAKTNTVSTVHRRAYTDYIGVKRFDEKGNLIGERRFIGLYTSGAYHSNPQNIPLLRHKVDNVVKQSKLMPRSHAGKALVNILETFPRDDLFQANVDELTTLCLGILNLQERDQVRLFARKDIYNRYMSCLVYVPRDRYDTELQHTFQTILEKTFSGSETSYSITFSDSILACIHYVIRIDASKDVSYDLTKVEKQLVIAARLWKDELKQLLLEFYGEEKGTDLLKRYRRAFPASYREEFEPRTAVGDIKYAENLSGEEPLGVAVYRPFHASEKSLRMKVFQANETIPLSDVMPILEDMGLNVLDERPYELVRTDNSTVWINDFDMRLANSDRNLNPTLVKDIFIEGFSKVWFGLAENDGFNRLILSAHMSWRECALLRAFAKYLRQISFTLSQSYIEDTFYRYPDTTRQLIELFDLRFNPEKANPEDDDHLTEKLAELEQAIEMVSSLDEDRIFHYYLALIMATLRTNFYQLNKLGKEKSYISFKFAPDQIPDMPLPRPKYEIFVYSPRFEGVHLRSGKVARGGLRWSDRREDFRTEVLGLMKAQQVKNAVIVPAGAKGGFVAKHLPQDGDRNDIMEEGIACYRDFIRGLLDITDNMVNNAVSAPEQVVRYDSDDPYLVVAADKGTATFSDIANEITKEYDFWLGDAFASGGSNGYDHKKMGITAKGAWESVKRHFRGFGIDTQTTDFTAVGVGDMAGDVFGNGMLLSEHIGLVGAFNHLHIFIDPNPDAAASYKERKRLFNLPRSSWADYNLELLSDGGGIFERRAKSINLSAPIKKRLGIKKDRITPDELIHKLLTAEVDLLWNGGIGTYVKSSDESDLEVGDKANDALRIDGDELRCKVVGEGGNLGFTQLGRIEFALNGGAIYTDFIDNSAGVDCSDHEVNLKILLNGLVTKGSLTEKQRNKLLADMTDDVSSLVLHNNYAQTQAIELAITQALHQSDLYRRYIVDLEDKGTLNRQLECLPDDKTLIERKANGLSLSQPELSVLFAYSKNTLKQELLRSDIAEDDYLSNSVGSAFPAIVTKRYHSALADHSLRREIIATQLSNTLVNEMGCVFVYRLMDETGASPADVVRAYAAARDIFDLPTAWQEIEALDYKLEMKYQLEMMLIGTRLIRRATRWILRNFRLGINIAEVVKRYSQAVKDLYEYLPNILVGRRQEQFTEHLNYYTELNVPDGVARKISSASAMFSALDIIEAATHNDMAVRDVANYYFAVGNELNLGWLREQINEQAPETHWETLALSAFRDDLDLLQRVLAISVLKFDCEDEDTNDRIQAWSDYYANLVTRWQSMASNIRASRNISLTVLFVGLRELMDLAQASSSA
tara:strand:+ start:59276 stop:64126 length:4851 start_codon:yes stop_codon:yes gene_type:complete